MRVIRFTNVLLLIKYKTQDNVSFPAPNTLKIC
jgi:hypothetical protein